MSIEGIPVSEQERRVLPEGWRWVRLGDIAVYINGMAFKPEEWEASGTPIIRIQNLNDSSASFNFFSRAVDSRYHVCDGDLLISWSASLDAYIWDRGPAILNQHIFKVVEKPDIVWRNYLYYAVREAMDEIRLQVHGATMRHITRPEFEAILVPLPPLSEQRRIAAVLTEHLSSVEQARQALEARLEAVRALPAALLRDVFESEEAQGWERRRLGEVAFISGGMQKTPDRVPVSFYRPYLTVRNVQRGTLDLSVVENFEVTPAELERYRLVEGDILIVEGNGSREQIGRNAIFSGEIEDAIHQNHLIRVRTKKSLLNPKFASIYLNSNAGKNLMLKQAQTTTGLHTLSVSKIEILEVPVPLLPEQARILDVFEDYKSATTQANSAIQSQLAALNAMPAGLLRKAFNGEL